MSTAILVTLLPFVAAWTCARPQKVNPSFAVTQEQAQRALNAMRARPRPLQRPLVILGGFLDPGIGALAVRDQIKLVTTRPPRIIYVTFLECTTFDQCRAKVIGAVQSAFPSNDPATTVEVDVIGVSMGGLVARVAAETGAPGERRLKIARLFTLASPLRGAKLAEFPIIVMPLHRDMRVGSALLQSLNAARPPYPVYPYTRLHDSDVGETLCAPDGQSPWWLDNPPLQDPHIGTAIDARILADIARRLRGEEPFASDPPAPLPRN